MKKYIFILMLLLLCSFASGQWNSPTEPNSTQGYVYLTSNSFTDTFEHYQYQLGIPFEQTYGSCLQDCKNQTLTTNHVEGTYALKAYVNINKAAAEYALLRTDHYPHNVNISGGDTFALWFYISDHTKLGKSLIAGYGNLTLRVQLITRSPNLAYVNCDFLKNKNHTWNGDEATIIDGWNRIEMPVTNCSEFGTGYNPESINRTQIIFYNATGDVYIAFDHLYTYNSSDYYNTTNWDKFPLAIAELQVYDNGYGYNTTTMAAITQSASYLGTIYNISAYENFEIITTVRQVADLGTNGAQIQFYNGSKYGYTAIGVATYGLIGATSWVSNINANSVTNLAYGWADYPQGYQIRFVKNDTWCSWYIKRFYALPWVLLQNATCPAIMSNSQEPYYVGFIARESVQAYDNILIRELVPKYANAGEYHASYCYQSANTTAGRGYTTIDVYRNNTLMYTYTRTVDDANQTIPVNLTAGYWRFNVEVFDANGNSANNDSQTIYIGYDGFFICDGTHPETLNISYYLEDWPTTLVSAVLQMEGTTTDTYSGTTKPFNFSFTTATSHAICIEPANATLNADLYAQYTTATGFTHRYYIVNGTFNTTTQYIGAYNYNYTTGISDLIITVRDQSTYLYMKNIIGKLQRRYVGEGVWRTVQMDETGDTGILFYNIKEENTDYRIIFVDRYNHVLETTQSMKFVCDTGICEVLFLLEPYTGGVTDYNLTIDYDFNNVTGIITVTWQDEDWIPVTVNTVVTKEMLGGYLTLCNVTSIYTANGTHTCNISGQTGMFLLRVRTSRSPFDSAMAEWIEVHFTPILALIGTVEGALISFFIVLVIVMTGVISPVVVVIMTVVALLVTMYLGMLSGITLTFFIVAGVLGLIISLKVKG